MLALVGVGLQYSYVFITYDGDERHRVFICRRNAGVRGYGTTIKHSIKTKKTLDLYLYNRSVRHTYSQLVLLKSLLACLQVFRQ